MKLSRTLPYYDEADQTQLRVAIERADDENLKRGRDLEIHPARIIVRSPNGSRWAITVSNTGTLSATAI